MIFTSVSSLITVGSGFPASRQAFGLLDSAEGAVYYVHNLQFLPSAPCPMEIGRFAYTEVNSPTGVYFIDIVDSNEMHLRSFNLPQCQFILSQKHITLL